MKNHTLKLHKTTRKIMYYFLFHVFYYLFSNKTH